MSDVERDSAASLGSATREGAAAPKFFVYGKRRVTVENEREDVIHAPTPHGAADAFKARHPGFDVCSVEACPISGDGRYYEVAGRCESCGATIFHGDASREGEDGVRLCGKCFGDDC